MKNDIKLFEQSKIRSVYDEEKDIWYFSVIDVIAILTENERPRKYWSDLKKKLTNEGYIEVSEKIGQLKMMAPDGKMRETDVAALTTRLSAVLLPVRCLLLYRHVFRCNNLHEFCR